MECVIEEKGDNVIIIATNDIEIKKKYKERQR